MSKLASDKVFIRISSLLDNARNNIATVVNYTMVNTYFEIGKIILEEEQKGKSRADYGEALLKKLAYELTHKFGKGFSVENLDRMRYFYKSYSDRISSTVLTKFNNEQQERRFRLSWSHYVKLMRMTDINERNFYEIEATKNNWSIRELQRQYDSALYSRLILSRNKEEVLNLSREGLIIQQPKDVIKDPYILEFLGLPEKTAYTESELEQELIDKLEHFLLELGTGFTFVARQKRISFDEKHFKIDLVFYNRFLKCFVLVDLKIGELKHQDIGQMQMYVNYFDREIKLADENKTIGIILCRDKSESVVKYTLPENNEQIFASKYLTVLPSRESLIKLIEDTNK